LNKRIISILLCFVMLFSMLVYTAPAYSSDFSQLKVTSDKATANPGDTVNFSVSIGAVNNLGILEFQLKIPDGLTIIEDSVTLPEGLEETIDSDGAIVKPWSGSNWFWRYSAQNKGYTGSSDLVLVTFTCKVNDDCVFEDKTITVEVESFYDNEINEITYSVVPVVISVESKPVPVTGVTIDETVSLKTGQTRTPNYTVNPTEATNKAVSFMSNNTGVATVNKTTGEVTGIKSGTAIITITTADGNFTDTCVVTVACSHAVKKSVPAKASDCKNMGWDDYMKCDDCDQLFKSDGVTEIKEIPFRQLSEKHIGGTATCTAQAICDVCNNPYGNLAFHSYTVTEKKAEALKTEGNCRDIAVYYYSCSVCGLVENNDNHTFLGDTVPDKHVGGTTIINASEPNHKTQQSGYTGDTKCLGCGDIIAYGKTIPADAHIPADIWFKDETHHWKECNVVGCGVVIDGSKTEHSSDKPENKATCQKQAVCDVCGVSYGKLAVCRTVSIEITVKPDKIIYLEGESFDKTGMIVTAFCEDDKSAVVTDYTISGYTSTPGIKTITVTYDGKTASFTVDVIASGFAGGTGTKNDPYLIETKDQLDNVRNYLDAHFKMIADIEFTDADFAEGGDFYNNGKGWEPIGISESTAFTGVFDGNGHVIKNLYINKDNHTGLFAYAINSTIKNLGIEDSNILASSYFNAGGIVGEAENSSIINCYNSGSISATGFGVTYVGGIAGYATDCIFTDCYNTGKISANANNGEFFSVSGGIVGLLDGGRLTNCYNTGDVFVISNRTVSAQAGGVAGEVINVVVTNCYNQGYIHTSSSGSYSHAGGIAGKAHESTINSCYNAGGIFAYGRSNSAIAGGIAAGAYHDTVVNDCYNVGRIFSHTYMNAYAGGIAADIGGNSIITICYNVGEVSAISDANSIFIGGIAGDLYSGTVTNCYYLDNISTGVGNGVDACIKYPSAEMQKQENFDGFNFNTVWKIDLAADYTYPTLIDNSDAISNITEFAGGTGTKYDPYLIETKEHLNNVRKYTGSYYKLITDIVFTEEDFAEGGAFYNNGIGWKPIGDETTPFSGVFDGNGHVIKNLYINIESDSDVYAGLFGYLSKGTITNLGMVNSNITVISLTHINVGGIVGGVYYYSTITNCYNTGNIYAENVLPNTSLVVGGISGRAGNHVTITNCYNTGKISANMAYTVEESYGKYAGGIVGDAYNNTVIRNCYNTGDVLITVLSTSIYNYIFVGGIFGKGDTNFSCYDCYNVGNISANEPNNNYSIKGIGYGDYENCYYLQSSNDSGGHSLRDMKRQSTYVGFDFETVWTMGSDSGYGYPTLKKTPHKGDVETTNDFAGGAGTESNPYLIETKEQLDNVRNYLDAHFKMIADIEFTDADFAEGGNFYNNGKGWEPIGNNINASYWFVGSFDGNGHTIKNLYVNNFLLAGLFGCVVDGMIKNLGLVDSKIIGETVGGIAATISNSTIMNCYNTGDVSCSGDFSYANAGGIAGTAFRSTITDSFNKGNVSALHLFHETNAGGIVALLIDNSIITNCYNEGDVFATSSDDSSILNNAQTGGIASYVENSTVINCYNTGTISSSSVDGAYTGGITGKLSGNSTISTCYNIGAVSASASSYYAEAGGIVGCAYEGAVTNCYNNGDVFAMSDSDNAEAGGVVGYMSLGVMVLTNCYNTGNVSAVSNDVAVSGGIVGYMYSGTITDCYYLDNISTGVGKGTDTCIKCTSAEMKKQETFVGFDFETVWEIEDEGYEYPLLQNNAHHSPLSIQITTKPNKLTYLEGETFDKTGMVVTAYFDDNTSRAVTGYIISGYTSTPGSKTITVRYNGKIATFTVEVIAKSLTHIDITTKPAKLTYLEGDSFDKSGMVVTAYYDNDTSVVLNDYTIIGYSSTVGTKTIIVTYQGKTATFTVTVKSRVPSAITSFVHMISGSNISKITAGTTASELLDDINEGEYCKIFKGSTEVSDDMVVGTGMTVKIMDGNTVKATYTIIVTGDTNGDGDITITDMIAIKAHILEKTLLSGVSAIAADTNGDGEIAITDFIQVKAKILGKGEIIAR